MKFIFDAIGAVFLWLVWCAIVFFVLPVPESFLGLLAYFMVAALIVAFFRKK